MKIIRWFFRDHPDSMRAQLKAALLVVIIVLVGAALSGCASTLRPVKVVWLKSADPDQACRSISAASPHYTMGGCSYWSGDTCYIIAKDFRTVTEYREMIYLGHELKHCFDGQWH